MPPKSKKRPAALADNVTPLDVLISVYRNPGLPVNRESHAAAKAAPYIHR